MPPSITLEMAKGFTLYMVKALISGRGGATIGSRDAVGSGERRDGDTDGHRFTGGRN